MAHVSYVAAFFLSLIKLSIGQREVTVQKGPLFRAEGYPASISCKVTGHKGPSEQHFQWSIYLPTAPTQEVQIVSTKDDSFSYALYAQRVRSREIYVERVQGNSVVLHIANLQMKDAGEYECHTPSTDETYFGSYSAKTTLTDFMLAPGPSYTERFEAGDVRLDKLGVSTFRLSIGRLQPSDQGQLFCEAIEWIQDPDETWTFITKKQTNQTALEVQPEVKDFQVNLTAGSMFAEGKPLELVCLVLGSSRAPQLQGVWFFNDEETASVDAAGVLDLKTSYRERASQGQLQVSKLSPKAFSLRIFSAGPEDEGTYRCVVMKVERTQTGSWRVLQRKQSQDSPVRLRKPAARSVTLSEKNKRQAVWEGEALALLCQAGGEESPILVRWWHIPQGQTQPEFVAAMGQDGTVQLGPSYGESRNQGNVRLAKVNWATFQLDITSTAITDSGTYQCEVSEMIRNQARNARTQILVTVKSLESSLQVTLMSRQPQVKRADTFDLSCIIRAGYSDLKLPLTVTWQFQPAGSQVSYRLIQMAHNGTIEWGDGLSQFPKKTEVSQGPFRSQLLIHDATEEEAGVYQCQVEVYDRNSLCTNSSAKAKAISHPLRIAVALPKSTLKMNSTSQAQEVSISSNVDIACSILARSEGNLPLSVIWYFAPNSANPAQLKILEMDQNDVIQYGGEFLTPRRKQKFHMEKVSQALFQLHILNADHEDLGSYHCAVDEWLLLTNGTWHRLGEKKSGPTELKIKPTGSEVRVFKENWTENAIEHSDVALHCQLESSGSLPSLFSVTWYWSSGSSRSQMLVSLQHDGLLEYGEEGLAKDLHCYRSSPKDFVLKLHRVELRDAGRYWCRVSEWQLHGKPSKWVNQASDESWHVVLTVLPSEPTFPSRICSSPSLLYFLVICPLLLLALLLASLLCLHWKTKRLATLRFEASQEKALWVGMKRVGDKTSCKSEEDEEEEGN
ncbi:immunoglobulin superfamily member 2 isoform X2 [Echinops telfairi]|uniref:immunoglobulin superfamily member 2 isoform X2 n=1 Tax=Echinops telfairi TaxID=9371 RepID=UPI000333936B|nr:immunoglobulin superfamily member 2 isoform X2 [Echinops telfairi]